MKITIDEVIDKFEEVILSFSIILMAVILVANVLCRTFLNFSLGFAEEIGQFLVIINTFMGISYTAKKARHINMSAIFDMVPKRMKKIMIIIVSAFTSAALFYLGYLAVSYTSKVFELGRVSPALRIPMWIYLIFVPIGFLSSGLQYARNAYVNIKEKDIYLSNEIKLDDETGEKVYLQEQKGGES